MRCKYCNGLTVTELSKRKRRRKRLSQADTQLDNGGLMTDGFYKHQPSLRGLMHSADKGCDICQTFLRGFQIKRPSLFGLPGEDEISSGESDDSAEEEWPDDVRSDNSRVLSEGIFVTPFYDSGDDSDDWVNMIGVTLAPSADREPTVLISFDLFVSHDDPHLDRTFILGRSIARNPLSNEGINLMKGYISDCMRHHGQACLLAPSTLLPTRVLDVGDVNTGTAPFLFESRNTFGSYVALSYCWGGITHHQTIKANFRQRTKKIDFDILPRTIRDAIKVTRALGFQYIWIDSLCIIQDDASDWKNEAEKMASVYGNSQVTIHASSAATSNEGFLLNRNKRSHYINWSHRSLGMRKTPQAFIGEHAQDWASMTKTSPLTTRGWTLQERMLSTRSLFFGKDQIYWECNACIRCENNMLAVPDIKPQRNHKISSKHNNNDYKRYREYIESISANGAYSRMDKAMPRSGLVHQLRGLKGQSPDKSSSQPSEWKSMLEEWSAIEANYSDRRLTNPGDKLPAVAGLMAALDTRYEGNGGQYVAGLWQKHINDLWGLLWKVDAPSGDIKIAATYRSPSWSWAKLDGKINTQIEKQHGGSSSYQARVLSVRVEGSFVDVKRAHIIIQGDCGYLSRKLFFSMEHAEQDGQPFARITADSGQISRDEQLAYVAVHQPYCIRIKQWEGDGLFYKCQFLLLTAVPNRPNAFYRIGIGEAPIRSAHWVFPDHNYSLRSWDKLWHKLERRTITLL